MVPDLVQEAAATAGVATEPRDWSVVGDYTHLVLASPDLVLKFWRSEAKQRVDTIAHRLAASQVPVPPLLAAGHVRAPADGCLTSRFPVRQGQMVPFSLYRRVPGARPAEEASAGWSAAARRRAYRQAGAWLRALHDVRCFERAGPLAATGGDCQGVAEDWCSFLLDTILRWDVETARHALPRQDRRLRRQVRNWLIDQLPRAAGAVDRLVLCHRDYSFRNLLAGPDGDLVAVIDFESAVAGDPVFDWHRIAAELLCRRPDEGCWQAFLEGYGAGDAEPAREERLLAYLGLYGVTAMGYALREHDAKFYAEAVQLMAWVAARVA